MRKPGSLPSLQFNSKVLCRVGVRPVKPDLLICVFIDLALCSDGGHVGTGRGISKPLHSLRKYSAYLAAPFYTHVAMKVIETCVQCASKCCALAYLKLAPFWHR